MPSTISCPGGHTTRKTSIREASIALSEKRTIGTCETCGKPLQYRINYIRANNDPAVKQCTHAVSRAVRPKARLGDEESYDPFLLVLCEIGAGKEQILPVFFAPDQTSAQRSAPPAPLLTCSEWKTLFRRLDATFSELGKRIRVRAYELYERRGRRDGSALEDWLQTEAELSGEKELRTAA